jgi:hypothetical protein
MIPANIFHPETRSIFTLPICDRNRSIHARCGRRGITHNG